MTDIASLEALPPFVVVRGIAHWLGVPEPEPAEPEETYEAFLDRISRESQ